MVADAFRPLFEGFSFADVDADGGVEFERPPAGGDFRAAVGDADFFPDLVDEDGDGFGTADKAGELAHDLAHEPRLQAHMRGPHIAFNLLFGD